METTSFEILRLLQFYYYRVWSQKRLGCVDVNSTLRIHKKTMSILNVNVIPILHNYLQIKNNHLILF